MNENKRTLVYAGVAVVLAVLAIVVAPRRLTSDAFLDQGDQFYPDFTDPNAARTLEVVEFDEETGTAVPFKVTFKDGLWRIPSHYDYPADAEEHLAQAAAGLIGLEKDDYRGNTASALESFGLVDPTDQTAGLSGRGTRITIKGQGDVVLADFILGKEVEDKPDFRFVRVPNSNRVYATKVDVDLSTRFRDWIDTDLLQLAKHEIDVIVIKDYSINERTRSLDQRDVINLTRNDDGSWATDDMPSGKMIDTTLMRKMLNTLDSLLIVGVRPKPAGLTASLRAEEEGQSISQSDAMSLQSKGFYFANDGRLLSNEGEMQVMTDDGVMYTLRFGEVVIGSDEGDDGGESSSENRFLFVSANFEPSLLPEPPKPSDTSFVGKPDSLLTEEDKENQRLKKAWDRWRGDVLLGQNQAEELNNRFAEWYYIISSDSYDNLHRSRADLVVNKK